MSSSFHETVAAPTIVEDYGDIDESGARNVNLAKISGSFLSEGAQSRNKRVYEGIGGPLTRAQDKIATGSILPMFSSHEQAAMDNTLAIAGKLTKVTPDGKYQAVIANTDAGRTLHTLIQGGYLSTVSMRARRQDGVDEDLAEPIKAEASPDGKDGWVKVKPIWDLQGIDFTHSPGISSASVSVGRGESSLESGVLIESFNFDETTGMKGCCDTCEDGGPCAQDGPCTCDKDCKCRADSQSAVDGDYFERTFNADQRKKAAASGAAMPDGSFPIKNAEDLKNAIKLVGNAKNPAAAKAHVKKRAKALGLTSQLPDDWQSDAHSPNGETQPMSDEIVDAMKGAVSDAANGEKASEPTYEAQTKEGSVIADALKEADAKTNETAKAEATKTAEAESGASDDLAAQVKELKERLQALEPKTEEVTPAPESKDLSTQEAVEKAVKEVREEFEKRIDEMLSARRKTHVVTEKELAEQIPEDITLGQALKVLIDSKDLSL